MLLIVLELLEYYGILSIAYFFKPCGSLGLLEEIVIQLAGISGEDLPGSHLKSTLICITDKKDKADEYEDDEEDELYGNYVNPLENVQTTTDKFGIDLTFAVMQEDKEVTAGFDFGRMIAEDISFRTPIIGLSILNDIANQEDMGDDLAEALLTEEKNLKYDAEEFLKHVPSEQRVIVSGVIGAIIAAAHNSSLVVVDTGAVEIIARYTEKLCPAIRPYILHATKLVVSDVNGEDDELDGEAACIAMEIVNAALHAANEMKSFSDTGVDVAIDGIGALRQR